MREPWAKMDLPAYQERNFFGGHNACPGCGSTTALRIVSEALGKDIIFAVPASCASIYFGPEASLASSAPVVHTVYPAVFAAAEGLSASLARNRRRERVVVWAGDGACYDIGLGGLSGIAARNADVLVFCNDNEGYQNTGGHRSSATPAGVYTKSSDPSTKEQPKLPRKDLVGLLAAHGAGYLATASAAFPDDLQRKVKKAMGMQGFRFIRLLTSCVTWGYDVELSVRLARLSVETGFFPLYEIEGGQNYTINHEPKFLDIEEFTKLQKRFRWTDLDSMRTDIRATWHRLRALAAISVPSKP